MKRVVLDMVPLDMAYTNKIAAIRSVYGGVMTFGLITAINGNTITMSFQGGYHVADYDKSVLLELTQENI